ncbi:MAG: FMN-binding glutamate synthase family protein [Rhodospirillales bacterium]
MASRRAAGNLGMERYLVFGIVIAGAIASLAASALYSGWFLILAAVLIALIGLGVYDLIQTRHSLLRNYPVIAHMRWLFEGIRPEIRQYLFEADADAVPFNRQQRALVYQRAKNELQTLAFGTLQNVYEPGYVWLTHSMSPKPSPDPDFRVLIGGPDCKQPYSASLMNISAMSFGSLSGNAILALNKGAKIGGFAHDTGEGSLSKYHRAGGGDIIWEIGSGYFGCRSDDGKFDEDNFKRQAADPQIKMIEIKLSQGAKPGHGGVLPAAKITPEISEARGVPMGVDCISPANHSAFTTPRDFAEFLGRLRKLSDGKPVGFKLCVGHRWEFMATLKAMIETGHIPDFIVVDGKEGGTGAAPLEFSNSIGTPLREGLTFVHNALIGAGLRDRIKLGASGKIISGSDIATTIALGADWVNSARGFMFSIGCIQAKNCHTNRCPTGVATQDPLRQRALVPEDKATRVANFHHNTLHALAEMLGAMGLEAPIELRGERLMLRGSDERSLNIKDCFPNLEPGDLLAGKGHNFFLEAWEQAQIDSFEPKQKAIV